MKHFYKITFFCCAAALWMLALASCEGGELYDVNAPEWISDKIQEIEGENIKDWTNVDEIDTYFTRMLNKEAYDKSGQIGRASCRERVCPYV